MSTLIEFESADHANYIHEAGVELKVVITWANVIGGGQDALHDQTDAHRVEQAKVLRNPVCCHYFGILFAHISVRVGSFLDNYNKHDAQQEVANIAEYVIERSERARLDHA